MVSNYFLSWPKLVRGCAAGFVFAVLTGCGKKPTATGPATVAAAVAQTSASCRECHADIFKAWATSDHALANRPVDAKIDAEALATFAPPAGVGPGTAPELVLGHKPLWQPLLPAPGGRWQPHELAYDPAKKEWFNVFGTEGRQQGEWGHWTGRGMNWNSMCAHCHMTGYQKNYDAVADSFQSTWVEHGVGCIQCHGPTKPGHGDKNKPALTGSQPPFQGDRQKMMQSCAPCHARNEQLTLDFQPGDNYHDHYRVTLPVEPGTYYPDGQQRDEDFNWTSILTSRMGHAGVTCFDCHDPHTNKTILPAKDNQLCMQCHAAPGRVQPNGVRAMSIDPLAHSHHADGSTGNACISCHMPTTNYMMRAPRHDHGWLKPDPLMTKELGIPNACSTCHSDKNVDWAIAKTNEWYGTKMDSRQRARARAVAAAQAGNPEAPAALLALLSQEDIPAWRATYLSLLTPYAAGSAEITRVGLAALAAKDPLERSSGARLMTGNPAAHDALRALQDDPVRLVRLDAAWALSPELAPDSSARKELDAYIRVMFDQPSGRLRVGQDLANRGDLAGAEKNIGRATEMDPYSPGFHEAHGMVLAAQNRMPEAAAKLYRAAELQPTNAEAAMQAALAYAEAGRLVEAETAFRLAVTRDPKFARAWYNLGLLLAQNQKLTEAGDALRRAAAAEPTVADYPYALATVLLRAGDRAGARAAAERSLAIDPAYPGAADVLRAAGAP